MLCAEEGGTDAAGSDCVRAIAGELDNHRVAMVGVNDDPRSAGGVSGDGTSTPTPPSRSAGATSRHRSPT